MEQDSSPVDGFDGADVPTVANPEQEAPERIGHGDACVAPDVVLPIDLRLGSNPIIGAGTELDLRIVIGDDAAMRELVRFLVGVRAGNRLRVGDFALVGRRVTLGDRVVIGNASGIEAAVMVGHDVWIGDRAIIRRNAVIKRGATIESNAAIQTGARIGAGATIEEGALVGGTDHRPPRRTGARSSVPPETTSLRRDTVEDGASAWRVRVQAVSKKPGLRLPTAHSSSQGRQWRRSRQP